MEKNTKINVWYMVAIGFGVMILQSMWSQSNRVVVVPYSEVQRYLEAEQVQEMVVTETHVYGVLKLPLTDGKREFSAVRVEPELAKDLAKYDIKISGGTEQTLFKQLLGWVLPAAIFVGLWLFVMRRFAQKQ
nr:cell division protein FtsH [Gammaproteobacteria bacterium]